MPEENTYKEALSHKIFEYISEAAENLSLETYAIGGFVRDYFLERGEAKDIDIVAVGSGIALAEEVSRLLPHQPKVQVFKTYGTAMLRAFDLEVEFVGARRESYNENSRNPEVEQGSLEDDQNRRDFTINALALQLNKENFGKLLDPFNGLEHLKQQLIKTPLAPGVTYSDDPLRMMRAIRFATQLGFKIEEASLDAITENHKRIKIISRERIVEELHKILSSEKPSIGFALLRKTKLLPIILPELSALQGIDEKEGQRHKDNFWHTLEVVDNISENTDNVWLRWAALLHDIGKAPTKKFHKKIGWTFHGHEFVGAKMVFKLFKRLKMPLNEKMKFVQKMVLMSSRPIVIAEDHVTDSAVRRLIFDAGDHIEDLMTLCEADITTKNPKRFKKYHNNFKIVRQKLKEVEERDHIRNFQPPVSGEEIMETFNIRPSKEIGMIKSAIKEAILEGEIPNEYEAAQQFMLKKGKELGLTANKTKNV
ncbi:CCA tRNA nucleotidyltransferase [Mesonia mobilis]|uniref:CCA tRNA nucleotidyltransferase n=1 Tax=Mesonia mobilis TaxID=369791 RepID=UPI0026F33A27|nr:HD domain-containing protein [Mesonia mobilis]